MEALSLQILLILFFLSLYCYLYALFPSKKKPANKGFKAYPIVGALPEFLRNRHRFLEWTTETLSHCPTNSAVFHRPGKVHGIITANPLNVEYILKTNFENYPKGDRFINLLEDFLGRGIFNSDGELWRVQRKTASYEFNTKSLRNFVMENVEVEISTRLVPILAKASKTKQVLDLQDILERKDEDSTEFLRDIVISFILAGRDTTSSALSCFEELRDMHYFAGSYFRGIKIVSTSASGIQKLAKVMMMYCQTVHLWERNGFVTYHTYAMGRMESIWGKNCRDFVPERWLENGIYRQESPFKFPVFHAGPRMCLGKDMAYIQMKSIAASVMSDLRLNVQNKEKCPEHLLSLTLRMKGGLQVKVTGKMSGNEVELNKISPCMINNLNQLHGKLVFGSICTGSESYARLFSLSWCLCFNYNPYKSDEFIFVVGCFYMISKLTPCWTHATRGGLRLLMNDNVIIINVILFEKISRFKVYLRNK
uniref:Cytochrome P450 family protein n=1 Tax=Populus alba TaxID=43335 RepID=A0A4U5PM18_POPAL|nr:hypothetical protein D5086_0000208070 [Populus alba]